MRRAGVVALITAALIGFASSAPSAERGASGALVVSGGTLVDGTSREPQPNATIVIRDGRVAEVIAGSGPGPAGGESIEHASGFDACDETVAAQVVRRVIARGAYVVPTMAVTEQMSRFGLPEQETMPLLSEIPPARRLYWRRAATAASPDRREAAARRLGCLKAFVARLQSAGGQVVAGSDT